MQTRGTFGQIDRRQLTRLPCPDFSQLNESGMQRLVVLFDRIREVDFPSIPEQLQTAFSARVDIDDAFLTTLGVADARERQAIGDSIRKAALSQVSLLQRAMSGD